MTIIVRLVILKRKFPSSIQGFFTSRAISHDHCAPTLPRFTCTVTASDFKETWKRNVSKESSTCTSISDSDSNSNSKSNFATTVTTSSSPSSGSKSPSSDPYSDSRDQDLGQTRISADSTTIHAYNPTNSTANNESAHRNRLSLKSKHLSQPRWTYDSDHAYFTASDNIHYDIHSELHQERASNSTDVWSSLANPITNTSTEIKYFDEIFDEFSESQRKLKYTNHNRSLLIDTSNHALHLSSTFHATTHPSSYVKSNEENSDNSKNSKSDSINAARKPNNLRFDPQILPPGPVIRNSTGNSTFNQSQKPKTKSKKMTQTDTDPHPSSSSAYVLNSHVLADFHARYGHMTPAQARQSLDDLRSKSRLHYRRNWISQPSSDSSWFQPDYRNLSWRDHLDKLHLELVAGYSLSTHRFTIVIKKCGHSGRWKEALHTFYLMNRIAQSRAPPFSITNQRFIQHEFSTLQDKLHSDQFTLDHIITNYVQSQHVLDDSNLFFSFQDQLNIDPQQWRVIADRHAPNLFTYTALISAFAKSARWKEALYFLRFMKKNGIKPDAVTYAAAISACHRASDIIQNRPNSFRFSNPKYHDLALNCAQDQQQYSTSTSQHSDRQEQSNIWSLGIELLAECVTVENLIPDIVCFNAAISCCAKGGAWETAYNIWQDMVHQWAIEPDVITYGALITTALRSMRWNEALKVYDILRQWTGAKTSLHSDQDYKNQKYPVFKESYSNKIASDNETSERKRNMSLWLYNAALSACEKGGLCNEALIIYKHIQEDPSPYIRPDIVTYNTLISLLGKAGRIDDAFDMFQRMIRDGITPDIITYNSVIAACRGDNYSGMSLAKPRPDLALSLLESMKRTTNAHSLSESAASTTTTTTTTTTTAQLRTTSQNIPVARPDIVTFVSCMFVCARAQRYEDVLGLFQEMQEMGIAPNSVCLGAVLASCADNGVQIRRILESVKERWGLIPDNVAFHSALSACASMGLWKESIALVQKMRQYSDVEASHYNKVLHASLKADPSNMKRAVEIITEMKINSVRPNIETFNIVLNACETVTDAQTVMEVVANVMPACNIAPDSTICLRVLRICVTSGRWKEAIRLYELWNQKGYEIRASGYQMVLEACALGKKFDVALGILNQMRKSGLEPNDRQYELAMEASNQTDFETGNVIFERSSPPNMYQYELMLRSCAASGDSQKARWLLKQAPSKSFNMYLYTIRSCAQSGDIDNALKITHSMSIEKHGTIRTKSKILCFREILNGCRQYKKSKAAYEILGFLAQENDMQPDLVAYNLAIESCVPGQSSEALKIFEFMKKRNIVFANDRTYMALLFASLPLTSTGTRTDAIDQRWAQFDHIWNEMKKKNLECSMSWLSDVVEYCRSKGYEERAQMFEKELKEMEHKNLSYYDEKQEDKLQ